MSLCCRLLITQNMISALEVLRDSRKTLRQHPRGRGRPRSRSAPAVIVSEVAKKRKQWTDEAMLLAMAAVKNGMSVSRAAKTHGVPRTTLHDRISGRVAHGTNLGRHRIYHPMKKRNFLFLLNKLQKLGMEKAENK